MESLLAIMVMWNWLITVRPSLADFPSNYRWDETSNHIFQEQLASAQCQEDIDYFMSNNNKDTNELADAFNNILFTAAKKVLFKPKSRGKKTKSPSWEDNYLV